MSEQAVQQQQTAADALAQRAETRQGTGSAWAEALRETWGKPLTTLETVTLGTRHR